jgi:hypothetical protein
LTVHEIGIRREVAHRLDATFKVLSAKIGKHGSATHHLANFWAASRIPGNNPKQNEECITMQLQVPPIANNASLFQS